MVESFVQIILKESEMQLMYIFKKVIENTPIANANKIKDIVRDLFKMSTGTLQM